MKRILFLALAVGIICSCSKKGGDVSPPAGIPDTLSAGWSNVNRFVPNGFNSDIFFTNSSTGFLTTNYGLFKSVDGGVTWAFLNAYNKSYNIAGYGTKYCFIGGDNQVVNTIDGNSIKVTAYLLANTTIPPISFRDCFFSSQNIAYICSGRYIYKSTDGAAHFDSVYNFNDANTSIAIFFTDDLNGWTIRNNGFYQTTDGGLSWTFKYPIRVNQAMLDFVSASTGFVTVDNTLYKTTDGGNTFNMIASFTSNMNFMDVDMIDAATGYLSAGTRIYKTVDGGNTWSVVAISGQNGFNEIHFLNANTGWACSNNGAVYRFKQ